jgi:hypothetical protein
MTSLRAARKISIHCPISKQTYAASLNGHMASIEQDPAAARLLAIIRGANALGDFDLYQGVFELSFGLEGFTPTEKAQPTEGRSGEATLSPTAVITTYVDGNMSEAELGELIEQLARAHPWELPVIEVSAALQLLAGRN